MKNWPEELNLFRRKQLPVLLGAEAAECGLVSMTMILRYHGFDVDLNQLRQRFSLSISGATLRSLIKLADQLGFSSRPLRVEIEHLDKISAPAILHWDLNHFVVLEKVTRSGVVIHDPATGRRKLSKAEVSDHFTGVVLELAPAESFRPIKTRKPSKISALWSKIDGFWSSFAQIMILSVAMQAAVFAAPFQLQLVVDEALGRADADLLIVLALGFGGLVIIRFAIEALRSYAVEVLAHLLTFQVVGNLMRHLLRLKTDFFEKRHVGDILSRIGSSKPIQEAVSHGVVACLIDGVMAVIVLVILFFYSAHLTLVVLGAMLLSLLITITVYPMLRLRTEEAITAGATAQSHMIESVRAAKTIKIMGGEAERESRWRNLFAAQTNAFFSVGKLQIAQDNIQACIIGLQQILVIYLSGRMILTTQGFSIGMLFAYLSFQLIFTERTLALIKQSSQFRLLKLHMERLDDILFAEPEPVEKSDTFGQAVAGCISMRDISFRYGSADTLVLEGLNLEVKAGEFLAITGPSGGGKTTLTKLMLGLYDVEKGVIELDGLPSTTRIWRSWREHVGVVAQDDKLLSGTLAENISFFAPEIDMNRVREAATAARVHDDIEKMPMRYLSLVGDMGSALSGGQRQRILLARALYRQPSILILDEGTANLDPDTENQIADLVAGLKMTRVVVAHRPALIERADRVVAVMNREVVKVR